MERLNTVVNENRKFYYKLLVDDDILVTREVALVGSDSITGLLPFSIITKESGVELRYEITALAKLSEHIINITDFKVISNMLNQMIETLIDLNNNKLMLGKILFDLNQVVIDIYSGQIYFIYIPLNNYNAGFGFPDFLVKMLENCGVNKENSNYVNCYSYLKQNISNLNIIDFKNFLATLSQDIGAAEITNNNFVSINSNIQQNNDFDVGVGVSSVPSEFQNISAIKAHNTIKFD